MSETAKGTHVVVLYIDEPTKCFTITAREKNGARLDEVDKQMDDAGYQRELLAECLDKNAAEQLKRETRSRYETNKYTYKTRPQLPNTFQ